MRMRWVQTSSLPTAPCSTTCIIAPDQRAKAIGTASLFTALYSQTSSTAANESFFRYVLLHSWHHFQPPWKCPTATKCAQQSASLTLLGSLQREKRHNCIIAIDTESFVQLSICNLNMISEGANCTNSKKYRWIVLPSQAAIGFNRNILWPRWNHESSRTKPVQSSGNFRHQQVLAMMPRPMHLHLQKLCHSVAGESSFWRVSLEVFGASVLNSWNLAPQNILTCNIGRNINTPESRWYNRICQTTWKQRCPRWWTLDYSRSVYRFKGKNIQVNTKRPKTQGDVKTHVIKTERCRICWCLAEAGTPALRSSKA